MPIEIGRKYRYFPEDEVYELNHQQHIGKIVTVEKEGTWDLPNNPSFTISHEGGWKGVAWADELTGVK